MNLPAHITRLITFAQHNQPKDYGASDMMRSDLEQLIKQAHAPTAAVSEIVAYRVHPRFEDLDGYFDFTDDEEAAKKLQAKGWTIVPLYTTPPAAPLPEPAISTEHGPWVKSNIKGEEGESYCKRCLLRDKFLGSRSCDPHITGAKEQ